MAIYMNYEGIKGDTTQAGHKDWITIESFSWGLTRSVSTMAGKNREGTAPSINDVTITKKIDSSTALLFQEATMGKPKTVKIDFCRTGWYRNAPDKEMVYLQFVLGKVLITAHNTSAPAGPNATVTESLSLSFTTVEMNQNPSSEDNDSTSPTKVGWNLTTNSSM